MSRSLLVGAVLSLSSCLGLDSLTQAEAERLETFDFYWEALADAYPLFGRSGLHWDEIRSQYRAAAPFAEQPDEFYHLLAGMLSELDDLHVSFRAPEERLAVDGVRPTSLLDVEGFALTPIEGRVHVVGWPAEMAPAAPERLPAGAMYPELLRVEGFPVVLSLVHNLLLGPPASEVELHLRWRDGSITRHVLRRPAAGAARKGSALGHLDRGGTVWSTRRREPFTWLELATLAKGLPLDHLEKAIDRARDSDGLVLDLRRNLGGDWATCQRLAERFLRRSVDLVLVAPEQSTLGGLIQYDVFARGQWQPREPIYDESVVVLTSALTGSMAEHLARVLQRYAGAVVVGERTAGAEAGVASVTGPDGGELRFSATRLVDRTGHGLQDEGVVPDVSIRLTLDDLERLGPAAAAADWEDRLLAAAQRIITERNGAPKPASR